MSWSLVAVPSGIDGLIVVAPSGIDGLIVVARIAIHWIPCRTSDTVCRIELEREVAMPDELESSENVPAPKAMQRSVAAIVPCYNAGHRVRPVLDDLLTVLEHVIVVDDGSTDRLQEAIEGLDVELVAFPQNRGKGYALLAGFEKALTLEGVTCVLTLDSDGQHDPKEIPRLYQAFRESGAGLVIGSRVFDEEQVPWRSRFGNKFTIWLTGVLLGKRLPDTQSGYRLHSVAFVKHIVDTVPGGRYETEMEILVRAVRDGFDAVPVPIQTIYEEGNESSHFNALRDSLLIYRKLIKASLAGRRKPRTEGRS